MKSNKKGSAMDFRSNAHPRSLPDKSIPDKELRELLEELLTQLVVDIHRRTVEGGLLLPDATIFKATDEILALLTQAHNSAIEEMIEALGDVPDDIDNYGGEPRGVYTERAELRQKLEGLRK